jgi:HK97 family phage prohead protease
VDIDELVPELRAAAGPFTIAYGEVRDFEVRAEEAEDGDDEYVFTGHAAVFDQLSEELGGRYYSFREKIARGAFRKALDEDQDVVYVYDHDGLVLARTSASTLALREDPTGLDVVARAVKTTVANDLALSMRAGNVRHMSFAFTIAEDKWEETTHEDGSSEAIRTILKVDRLFDVSAVGQPAYPQTDAMVRSRMLQRRADRYGLQLPDSTDALEQLAKRMGSTVDDGREARKARLGELQAGAKRRLTLAQARSRQRSIR